MAKKKRSLNITIGFWGLTLAALSSMIGSGWLFGACKAARLAGPAAVLAWPVGALAMLLLAFVYAELGGRYPTMGGMVHYTQLSHGSFAGFIAGWANWIAIVAVIAIEAVSSVQYVHSWSWPLAKALYDQHHHQLTYLGMAFAFLLIIFYFLINYWSIKLFLRFTIILTLCKIIVPLITGISLWYSTYHHHLFTVFHHHFMPYGISGVLTAVATSGIIFSFHGFQSVINLSGEASHPRRNVPLAIFLSITLAFLLYLFLQVVFVGSVSATDLSYGWQGLYLSSPYAHLALAFSLHWLAILLYFDAFVSPLGTAVTYMATTSRMLYRLQRNGYMPAFIGRLHPVYHTPRHAMWVNLVVSVIFLLLFRGWGSLVGVISVATIISYVNGPVAAIALGYQNKINNSTLLLGTKGLSIIAPMAFIVISLVLYWARWPLTGEVIIIIFIGLPIYFYYQYKQQWLGLFHHGKSGIWLVCYLLTIALLSYVGSSYFGGKGLLTMSQSLIAVVVLSLFYYWWAITSRLR